MAKFRWSKDAGATFTVVDSSLPSNIAASTFEDDVIVEPIGPAVSSPAFFNRVPAAGVWSTRRVRSTHTGDFQRVRRSSDNAEANIGWKLYAGRTTPYWVDEDALLAHCVPNNLISANSGGAVGTPGTLPSNLSAVENSQGLTREIVAIGADYIDLRFYGTATGTGGIFIEYKQPASTISVGQTATGGMNVQLIAGSMSGTAVGGWQYRWGGNLTGHVIRTPDSVNFRYSLTQTINDAAWLTLRFGAASIGAAIDLTIRISNVYACAGTGGSGYVTTWYDQSGNGRDLLQSTASQQPRIVNAGAIERLPNGMPTVYMNSGNLLLTTQTGNTFIGENFVYNAVFLKQGAAGGTFPRLMGVIGTGLSDRKFVFTDTTTPYRMRFVIASPEHQSTAVFVANTLAVWSFVKNNTTFKHVKDGTTAGSSTVATGIPTGATAFAFGGSSPAGDSFIGAISEASVFSSAIADADRLILERNQGANFGVTVA